MAALPDPADRNEANEAGKWSAARPGPTAERPHVLRRARVAVVLLFFINGLAYANIVPRLPEIRDQLGLSDTALGLAIAAMPTGALLTGAFAGILSTLVGGSGRMATICSLCFAVVIPLVAVASDWWTLAACLFLVGVLDAIMDAAMNDHGIRVEHGYRRSILNSFHGVWSIGAVVGGLVGSTAAGLGLPLSTHLLALGVIIAVLGLSSWPMLLPHTAHTAPETATGTKTGEASTVDWAGIVRSAAIPLGLIGLFLVMASVVEDTPASWGASLLKDEYAATSAVAGLVYVAFQSAMTLGRFTGDRITDRFGSVSMARIGGLLAAVPVGAALLTDSAPLVIIAFGLAGFGASTLYPAAMQAAGRIPGIRSGDGIAIVSWLARLGFLAAPPLVGFLSDRVDLQVGVGVVVVAGCAVSMLSPVVRRRELTDKTAAEAARS